MKLNDLELNRYDFFARATQHNNDEEELWEQFKSRLESTVESIGGWENTSQKHLARPISRPGYFVPIATTKQGTSELVFHDGYFRKLISGVFLDVYVLQERIGLEASFERADRLSEVAQLIKVRLPQHSIASTQFPTECLCYFTESKEELGNPHEIIELLLGTDDFHQIELRHAFFGITIEEERADAVIISKTFEGREAKDKASKMFDVLLREYFLSFAKVVNEVESIERQNVLSSRKRLADYIHFLDRHHPETLAEIEKANQVLSGCQAELAEQTQKVEAHLHTIAVNVGNAERLLDNSLWREKREELHQALIKPLQYKIEQLKANLTYARISEDLGRIKGEEIANETNLKSASYGRKLAWIFGSLTLIGALQLFPTFVNWDETFVKALLLGLIILIPIWVAFAEDIRSYFFARDNEAFEPTENELPQRLRRELPPKSVGGEIELSRDAENTGRREVNPR